MNKHGVFVRKNVLYIRYYDPIKKKPVTESTEFLDTRQGNKDARKRKEEIVENLKNQRKSLKFRLIPASVSIEEAHKHYLKINAGKDKNTIAEYENFYNKYFTRNFPGGKRCTIITKYSIEEFLMGVKELELAQNTKYNLCKNTRKFLNFLFEYSYLKTYFVINKDVLTRQLSKDVIIYTPKDIRDILTKLDKKTINFRTMVYLLAFSGLRPSDLLILEKKQIDLEEETIKYFSKKLGKYRFVPIHSALLPVLKERMETLEGTHLVNYYDLRAIGKAFRVYLTDIGLKGKGYTLRTFRKYFVSESYDQDGEARAIAYIAGHSPQTADTFYRKFKMTKLKEEIEKFQIPKEQ